MQTEIKLNEKTTAVAWLGVLDAVDVDVEMVVGVGISSCSPAQYTFSSIQLLYTATSVYTPGRFSRAHSVDFVVVLN